MSTGLYWEPTRPTKGKHLSDQLKFALRNRHDEIWVKMNLDTADLSYLEGLRDAGINDAINLIDAINKYGSIKLWEE